MTITNEQAVLSTEREGVELRNVYTAALTAYCNAKKPKYTDLLRCHQAAISYFNHYENFVANSDLLGAHRSEHWAQNFAESCLTTLDTVANHFDTIFAQHNKHFSDQQKIHPAVNAFASMQRMAKEYCDDDQVQMIRDKFVRLNLPTDGFDKKRRGSYETIFNRRVSFFLGLPITISTLLVIFAFPNITPFQQSVIGATFALGLTLLVNLLPGTMELKAKLNIGTGLDLLISAAGTLAVFILMYLTID